MTRSNEPRFLQTDPIGYGAGMNMYAYVRNDPVNFIDPTGLTDVDHPYPMCMGDFCGNTGGAFGGTIHALIVVIARRNMTARVREDQRRIEIANDIRNASRRNERQTERNGAAGEPPPPRRRNLTREQRRACAEALGLMSMAAVTVYLGGVELAFAAAGGARTGATAGRLGGGWGMLAGAIIGVTVAYATYQSPEEARVRAFCAGM